jgi:pentatricopeptide repeat protein
MQSVTANRQLNAVNTSHRQGRLSEALHILQIAGCPIDVSVYVDLLQASMKAKNLSQRKIVHAHIIPTGFSPHRFLWNTLVNFYARCGSLMDARMCFDQKLTRDALSWTLVIAGYVRNGFAGTPYFFLTKCNRQTFNLISSHVEMFFRLVPNGVVYGVCPSGGCQMASCTGYSYGHIFGEGPESSKMKIMEIA